jgi:hypothetical protein
MCDALQAIKNKKVQVAFAQGTGADTSTRWTRRETTFKEAARMGTMLAGEALRVLEGITTNADVDVHCFSGEVLLPTRSFPSPEEADRLLEEAKKHLEALTASNAAGGEVRSAYVAKLGAEVRAVVARQGVPSHMPVEVGLLALGKQKIGILPGEVFAKTGLELRKALGEGSMALGYTNCAVGYILPPEVEAQGGYELGASLVKSEAEQQIRDAVMKLAAKIPAAG